MTCGRAFLKGAEGGGQLRWPPTQPSPAGRAATGLPADKAEREAAGARPRLVARTATPPRCSPPAAAPDPPAPRLTASRSAPRPPSGFSPATNKGRSIRSTAIVPRRPQQCRETPNKLAVRERPPQRER